MKWILIVLVLFSLSLSAQVKTYPQKHSNVNVFNATVNGGAGAATTSAINPSEWKGVITIFIEMDTTDSGTPGTAGLKPQIYNSLSGNWYDYHDLGDMFTIPAANWGDKKFYIVSSNYDDHAWADSLRWIFTPQSADTGTVRIDVGGQ